MKYRNSTYSLLFLLLFFVGIGTYANSLTGLGNTEKAVQQFLESEWGVGNVEWIPYGKQRDFSRYSDCTALVRNYEKPRGKTVLQVELRRDGKLERVIPYRVEITAFAHVPVLVNPMDRNQEIKMSDVTWEKRDVSAVRSEWMEDETFISESFWTRKRLKKGDILFMKDIEKKPDVIMGEPVTIVLKNGSVNLSVPGVARQNGKIGDIIKVVNSQYNKILRAKVHDKSIVILENGSI